MSADPVPVLSLRGISKSFSGVTVLKGVDFDVRAGEVHALLAREGAGKSTLIKVMAGCISRTPAMIAIRGVTHHVRLAARSPTPPASRRCTRNCCSFPDLTVAEKTSFSARRRRRLRA